MQSRYNGKIVTNIFVVSQDWYILHIYTFFIHLTDVNMKSTLRLNGDYITNLPGIHTWTAFLAVIAEAGMYVDFKSMQVFKLGIYTSDPHDGVQKHRKAHVASGTFLCICRRTSLIDSRWYPKSAFLNRTDFPRVACIWKSIIHTIDMYALILTITTKYWVTICSKSSLDHIQSWYMHVVSKIQVLK